MNITAEDIQAAEQRMAALGVARSSTALAVIDTLNAENRDLRNQLTIATVAAQAASAFYWSEFAGAKTYLTPTEVRERFGVAMVAYRKATGLDNG